MSRGFQNVLVNSSSIVWGQSNPLWSQSVDAEPDPTTASNVDGDGDDDSELQLD